MLDSFRANTKPSVVQLYAAGVLADTFYATLGRHPVMVNEVWLCFLPMPDMTPGFSVSFKVHNLFNYVTLGKKMICIDKFQLFNVFFISFPNQHRVFCILGGDLICFQRSIYWYFFFFVAVAIVVVVFAVVLSVLSKHLPKGSLHKHGRIAIPRFVCPAEIV